MSRERTITVRINGTDYTAAVPTRKLLSDFIREDAGLTGTHVGCEHGVCGACTVLVDGRGARSCLLFAVQADGREIRTVEDLGTPEAMSGLQESFKTHHGLQCGFCTPGFLMTLTALLESNAPTSDSEVDEAIVGNICRCTGYSAIRAAVRSVVREGGS